MLAARLVFCDVPDGRGLAGAEDAGGDRMVTSAGRYFC